MNFTDFFFEISGATGFVHVRVTASALKTLSDDDAHPHAQADVITAHMPMLIAIAEDKLAAGDVADGTIVIDRDDVDDAGDADAAAGVPGGAIGS